MYKNIHIYGYTYILCRFFYFHIYVYIYIFMYIYTPHLSIHTDFTLLPLASAIHCNTLQYTATHCNTLQHTVYIQSTAREHSAYTGVTGAYMCIYIEICMWHIYIHMYIYMYIHIQICSYTHLLPPQLQPWSVVFALGLPLHYKCSVSAHIYCDYKYTRMYTIQDTIYKYMMYLM